MDAVTKEKIESFAWNATVGAGRDPEECSEPDEDTLSALRFFLGHPLTGEEERTFTTAWARCVQSMEQP